MGLFWFWLGPRPLGMMPCSGYLFSLVGRFISLPGRQKFPECAARELARKGLICFTVFGRFSEKIAEIRGSQGKTGNLSPTAKRLVVGVQPA
jgi:hypothetical protein